MYVSLAGFVDCRSRKGCQREPGRLRIRMTSRSSFVLLTLLLIVVFQPFGFCSSRPSSSSLPIIFETNRGQVSSSYQFVSRHGTVEALFSTSGVDMLLPENHHGRAQIGFHLVGASPDCVPEARNVLPSVSHYLLGSDPSRWLHNVPNQSEVVYPQIYPGVDLIFHGSGDNLEHDFRISPGADPAKLRFAISGADRITLAASGDLEVDLPSGTLVFQKPHTYQESAHSQQTVESGFVLNSDQTVQFRLGSYDRSRELVVDPVFGFSTYLAGSKWDQSAAVTTDSSGNIYVTGWTESSDFPIVNGVQPQLMGTENAFVSKLDPTGHTVLYSTYLGGSSANYAAAIALDSKGNIVVSGISSSNDFPHAGGVPALSCQTNDACYFIASLTPDGSAFNYSGLIGGRTPLDYSDYENQGRLAVDSTGNAYLADLTNDPNFDITPGTLANSVPGYPYDSTFILKVSPTGALVYSTIVPGTAPQNPASMNNIFFPTGISVDINGQATIAGTASLGLPTTAGVIAPTFPNDPNVVDPTAGFVLQLNATATAINYATYVPGTDLIGGLAVDSMGNSFFAGRTSETTLPVSSNAYQKTIKPSPTCTCNSGFLLELDGAGKNVLAATYLGGTPINNSGANLTAIALDSHSNIYVGGWTGSSDFPLQDPFVSELEFTVSDAEMVLAEMNADMSSLLFGSFLSSTDQSLPGSNFSGLTIDPQDNLIVTGYTYTSDFPTTSGAFQTAPPSAQTYHPFITKFNMAVAAPSVCLDTWYVNFGQVLIGTSIAQTVHLTNCGNAPLNLASLVSSASTVTVSQTCGAIQPGIVCPLSLTYSPVAVSSVTGTVTLNDNAVISPQVIGFSGQAVASQTFALSPNPSSLTTTAGQPAMFTILASPQGTYTGTINFSCSGLPPLAGCSFNPVSLVPDSSTVSTTLTITTAARNAALLRQASMSRPSLFYAMWLPVAGLTLIVAGLTSVPCKKRLLGVLLCLTFCGLVSFTACGGSSSGGGSGGTPAGSYTITVKGTAGSTVKTTNVTLTVQ